MLSAADVISTLYMNHLSIVWLQQDFHESSYCLYNLTLSKLDKILSRQHIKTFYLFFTENRIGHLMQIVSTWDNLHKLSNPDFWENKKKYH